VIVGVVVGVVVVGVVVGVVVVGVVVGVAVVVVVPPPLLPLPEVGPRPGWEAAAVVVVSAGTLGSLAAWRQCPLF
jgi:hypothetical protein